MLLFILYNVLQGSDKNIVICQQYTYSPVIKPTYSPVTHIAHMSSIVEFCDQCVAIGML